MRDHMKYIEIYKFSLSSSEINHLSSENLLSTGGDAKG